MQLLWCTQGALYPNTKDHPTIGSQRVQYWTIQKAWSLYYSHRKICRQETRSFSPLKWMMQLLSISEHKVDQVCTSAHVFYCILLFTSAWIRCERVFPGHFVARKSQYSCILLNISLRSMTLNVMYIINNRLHLLLFPCCLWTMQKGNAICCELCSFPVLMFKTK